MEIYYQSSDNLLFNIYVDGSLADADLVATVYQVFVTITRASDGAVIVNNANAARISVGKYKYTLSTSNSSVLGRYKVSWTYTLSSTVNTKDQFYDVVVGYLNAQEVLDDFPDLVGKSSDEIYRKEKLARGIINSHCNQAFDFEIGKQYKIRGADENSLYLSKRIFNLSSVFVNGIDSVTGDDITSNLEIEEEFWLRPTDPPQPGFWTDIKKGITDASKYFNSRSFYYVTGDWGWESVPSDINLAAKLLVYDYFNDDNLLHQHGVFRALMGDRELWFAGGIKSGANDLLTTTGNYDVDILLSNYRDVKMRLI